MTNNFNAVNPTGRIDRRVLNRDGIIKDFALKRSEALPGAVLKLREAKLILQQSE